MHQSVKVLRGREAAKIAELAGEGWELTGQRQGPLRTELSFRKEQPESAFAKLLSWFRALAPATRKRFVIAIGGLGAALVIVVAVALPGGDGNGEPEAVADEQKAAEPSPVTGSVPTEEASPILSEPDPYSYKGPQYKVVIEEKVPAAGNLTYYWIVTKPEFDFSTKAYKAEVKAILADVAYEHGTSDFLASVVTNEEIAQAEAISTWEDFAAERGDDYVVNTIPAMEVDGWVASYVGGFDYDTGKKSDEVYEILWRPYATSELEDWQP
ncbi:hypothetical protein [Nocardioides sp. YIM 152588]|uniref:hypothetical protein n=1 Tax=Nocardioides sp. YIM 152588 TaxID=3158259 RepID=UPI0032E4B741